MQWQREELREQKEGISKNERKMWPKATALVSSQNWMDVVEIFFLQMEMRKNDAVFNRLLHKSQTF